MILALVFLLWERPILSSDHDAIIHGLVVLRVIR